jgi:hypothetical protein
VSDSTDAEGRFWWRGSLHVGRRTFWSLRPRDQILSFPVFQGLMLAEGSVMLGAIYVYGPGPWARMYMEVNTVGCHGSPYQTAQSTLTMTQAAFPC